MKQTVDVQIMLSGYFENDLGGQRGFQRNGHCSFSNWMGAFLFELYVLCAFVYMLFLNKKFFKWEKVLV